MTYDDGGRPSTIETQEQAAALASQIIQESGLSKEQMSPGSAKFLAHQILADHVIENQRIEVERHRGEVERLTMLLMQREQGKAPNRNSWSPRNSVPSPPAPINPAEPPEFTDSMARPDSALLGRRQDGKMTESELVHKLVALLKGQSQGQGQGSSQHLGSRKSSRTSLKRYDDGRRITQEIDSITGRTTALNVPNFTELAANTILSTEGKGGDVPMFPPARPLPPLYQGHRISQEPEPPVLHDSNNTTLPPPPFQNINTVPDDIDWTMMSRDVLEVVKELHNKAIEAEEQKAELESKLNIILASPRRVEDEVFDSPVEPLGIGIRHGSHQYVPLAIPPPTPPMGPTGSQQGSQHGGSQASSVFNTQRLNQTNTICEPPSALDVENYNWNPGNYGASRIPSQGIPSQPPSQVPTPVRSIQSPSHPSQHPSQTRELPIHAPQSVPISNIEERRMSSATVQSVVQGTMATPGGIPNPAPKHEVMEAQQELPEGWEEYKTGEGRPYYYNTATGKSHWKRPTKAAGKPLMINININVDRRKKGAKGDSVRGSSVAPSELEVPPTVEVIQDVEATPVHEEQHHVETIVQDTPVHREEVDAPAVPLMDQPPVMPSMPSESPEPYQPVMVGEASTPAHIPLHHPVPDYVVDDRSGSPIIVPPVNSITTVVVEAAPGPYSPSGTPGKIQIRGGSITQNPNGYMTTPDGNRVINIKVARCIACGTTLTQGATYCHNCGWRAVAPDVVQRTPRANQ